MCFLISLLNPTNHNTTVNKVLTITCLYAIIGNGKTNAYLGF